MSEFGTVLVTGANRGLGLEFTRRLAPLAERVIACCRNSARAGELNQIAAEAQTVQIKTLDVTDYPGVKALANKLGDDHDGGIDLLINNAGILGPRPHTWPQDVQAWRRVLETNTIAPLKVAEAFLDGVAASERRTIVNVTSKMGSIGDNESGSAYIYRSSKAALNATMRTLALDTAERGVKVLLLHPGWVKTDMGGPQALIGVEDSAAGTPEVIRNADAETSGRFLNYDGTEIPW